MVPQYGFPPPPSTPPLFKPMSDCSPSSSRDSEDSEAGSADTINSSSEGSDADGEFELDDGYGSEFVKKDLEEDDDYIPGQDESEDDDVDDAFVAEDTPPPGPVVGLDAQPAILAFATLLLKPTLDVGKIDAQYNHLSNLAGRCLNAQAYIIDLDDAFSMLLTNALRAAACSTWASKSADLTATFYEHVLHTDRITNQFRHELALAAATPVPFSFT